MEDEHTCPYACLVRSLAQGRPLHSPLLVRGPSSTPTQPKQTKSTAGADTGPKPRARPSRVKPVSRSHSLMPPRRRTIPRITPAASRVGTEGCATRPVTETEATHPPNTPSTAGFRRRTRFGVRLPEPLSRHAAAVLKPLTADGVGVEVCRDDGILDFSNFLIRPSGAGGGFFGRKGDLVKLCVDGFSWPTATVIFAHESSLSAQKRPYISTSSLYLILEHPTSVDTSCPTRHPHACCCSGPDSTCAPHAG
ncbi:hypothetical protein B0I37DRAFT_22443 [Chaetomium sp. MPI-CAGE-AT-0009]|nr:hypothetical protein B0I37DRAFT_22443 [Chaetomium sp. MPI-CAGE-AT-0009]